jgi:hypothetical protein
MEEGASKRLGRLENDVYYGNGKDNPSLTTRMATAEGDICDMQEQNKENRKDSKQIKLMLLGALLTLAADLLSKWIHL